MNIVDANVELCSAHGLEKIELIGKVCTKQEHTIKPGTAEIFCRNRLIDGHTAIFEHEYVYFDVSDVNKDFVLDFMNLSPYIRISYDLNFIALSYRTFLDIMYNSRAMKHRMNFVKYPDTVSNMFYVMLYGTTEFSNLLYDDFDILCKIPNGLKNRLFANIIPICFEDALELCPEIALITFKITIDRGVTHELVRHRYMSFMQESTRWCNYSKDKFSNSISVIMPEFKDEDDDSIWADVIATSEASYMELINNGETAQIARSILPNATKSDIYVSGTLDMWIGEEIKMQFPNITIHENKGFLPLRNHPHAHPQMIEVAKKIDNILNESYSEQINRIKSYK